MNSIFSPQRNPHSLGVFFVPARLPFQTIESFCGKGAIHRSAAFA